MIIKKDNIKRAIPIPQMVVAALTKNNRKKRGQLDSGKFRNLQKNCSPANACTGDSEFAYFSLTEINDWLKNLGVGQIQMHDTKLMKDYGLKVIFGSHFEIGDESYEPVRRVGDVKYPVFPDDELMKDPQFDLPSKDYLGQQTAILTIVSKKQEFSEYEAIIVPFGNENPSLDVAKLCPPDCS